MRSLSKFILLFSISILYIWIASFRLMENQTWQLLIFAGLGTASLARFGWRKLAAEWKLILPFVVSMLLVYLLIGLIVSHLSYWLKYGWLRTLNFINTMFFFQLVLSLVSMRDIIGLPLKMSVRKHIILGRALFCLALQQNANLEFHLRLLPEYQNKRLSLRQLFLFKLQQALAIIILLLREARLKGELIDNRIRHCHPGRD